MSINPQDLERKLRQILDLMQSKDLSEKHEGYTRLQKGAKTLHAGLSEENIDLLADTLVHERDPVLYQVGVVAAIKMFMLSGVSISAAPETPPPRHLGDFLFGDFKEKSAIFTVRDSDQYRRDESAETQILRRLSPPENFPLTETKHFFTGEQRAHLVLPDGGYKAVFVIGRPELYGPAFEDMIRCRSLAAGEDPTAAEAMRFGFETDHRPTDLPRNKIDPNFHCIVDRQGNGKPIRYATKDDGKQRTDYCIVQRYVVEISAMKVVIVGVLGSSSLGTRGGATWCGLTLYRDESIIPLPPSVQPHSRMEALLRVTADSTLGALVAPRIDLVSLSLDNQEWSTSDRRWVRRCIRGPDEITVIYRDGKAWSVLFDRRPQDLERGRAMFVLIVALAENALEGHKRVSIDKLQAALALAKAAGQEVTKATPIKKRLTMLKIRHLHDALDFDSSSASLHCKIRRVDES